MMKLMMKTMMSPHEAAPSAAVIPMAVIGSEAVATNTAERPTISANAPKMMSRIRLT